MGKAEGGCVTAVGVMDAPDSYRCGQVLRLVYFSYVHCADVTCQQQQQVMESVYVAGMYTD